MSVSLKDKVLATARERIKEAEEQLETAEELVRRMKKAGIDVSAKETELAILRSRLEKLKKAFE